MAFIVKNRKALDCTDREHGKGDLVKKLRYLFNIRYGVVSQKV